MFLQWLRSAPSRKCLGVFRNATLSKPPLLRHAIDYTYGVRSTIISQGFHTSTIISGRRSGSSALEPAPRPLSKKQIKRKSKEKIRKSLKINQTKENVKTTYLKNAAEQNEGKMMNLFNEMKEKSADLLNLLDLPEGVVDALDYDKAKYNRKHIDIDLVIEKLDKYDPNSKSSGSSIANIHEANGSSAMVLYDNGITSVTYDDVQILLGVLSKQNNQKLLNETMKKMESKKIPVSNETLCTLMMHNSNRKNYKEAQKYVDIIMKKENISTEIALKAWDIMIKNNCGEGTNASIKQAIAIIDRLKSIGSVITTEMFNSVLKAYIENGFYDDANEFWLRMHEEVNLSLNVNSFLPMFKLCSKKGEAERALLYFHELENQGLTADTRVFASLFRAVSTAPMWVNGYEKILFEVMLLMEGRELVPTTEIYNAIIYGFGRAGDSSAAEFYFWEMKNKGIKPDEYTYSSLLYALSQAQQVGARCYGIKGRFIRPPERKLTKEEQNMVKLGATKSFEVITKGITQDNEYLERGSRQQAKLVDDLDDDDGVAEAMDEIKNILKYKGEHNLSPDIIQQLEGSDDDEEDVDPIDFDELAKTDPELKRLMERDLRELGLDVPGGRSSNKGERSSLVVSNDARNTSALSLPKSTLSQLKNLDKMSEKDILALIKSNTEDIAKEEMELKKLMNDEGDDEGEYDDDDEEEEDGEMEYDDDEEEEGDEGEYEDQELSDADVAAAIAEFTKMSDKELSQDNLKINDNNMIFEDPFKDRRKELVSGASLSAGEDNAELSAILNLLDGKEDKNMQNSEAVINALAADDSNRKNSWKFIEFGRAPDPDYSENLGKRRKYNDSRAEKVFKDMLSNNIVPSVHTITNYVSVFAEAVHVDKALEAMKLFDYHNVKPNNMTYKALIKMHVKNKNDVFSALETKKEMESRGLIPCKNTYGYLIEFMTFRDMIPEALNMVDEAHVTRGYRVPEKHLMLLRKKCRSLGLKHPAMPADPKQWVYDMHHVRKTTKNATQRKIQSIKSKMVV